MNRKLSLPTRLRMWSDYLRYLIFLQQEETVRVVMGLVIFILSVYLLEHELVAKLVEGHGEDAISLVIILVILKFLWEAYVTRTEIKSYFHIQRSILRNNLSKPFVLPGENEQEAGFVPVEIPGNKADLIYASPKINHYLQTTPLAIKLSQTKINHINKYIQTHREILLQYLNHYFFTSLREKRKFTNDQKLCLSRDLNLNLNYATCHTGGYYDSFVTNQVSGTTLVIKDKVHTTITTEHIFPSYEDSDGNHYLHDISTSQMNDHLGCSTIGFTADNYLLIWVQGSINQFSRDLIIPTGSGSTNMSDMENHHLQKTIIRTMERELSEETLCSVPEKQNLRKTMILGFHRWVTRGGKPEFTGITKLSGTVSQYSPDPKETRTERSAGLKFKVESINDLPGVLQQIRAKNHLSTPLYMCLYQLEEMYVNHQEELKKFMFG